MRKRLVQHGAQFIQGERRTQNRRDPKGFERLVAEYGKASKDGKSQAARHDGINGVDDAVAALDRPFLIERRDDLPHEEWITGGAGHGLDETRPRSRSDQVLDKASDGSFLQGHQVDEMRSAACERLQQAVKLGPSRMRTEGRHEGDRQMR